MKNTQLAFDGNKEYITFKDILPSHTPMNILFVAKVPAPVSIEEGHYFQGRQGKSMWNKLDEYKIIELDPNKYEDDCLTAYGHGITDIVKRPREFGDEPTLNEYVAGMDRILDIIKTKKPKVLVFTYKKVLDTILKIKFGIHEKSTYGFNDQYNNLFGTKVFVFPMSGTPCTKSQSKQAMMELQKIMIS